MALIQWFKNKILPDIEKKNKILPHRTLISAPCSNNYDDREYYFPEDILIQILCRLPADHLRLLKTVSRFWKSIISSPYLVNLHVRLTIIDHQLIHHNSNPITIFMFTYERVGESSYNLVYRFASYDPLLGSPRIILRRKKKDTIVYSPGTQLDNFRLIGSCDGLLMFHKFFGGIRQIFILNPITRETRLMAYPERHIVGYVCGIFFDRFEQQHKLLYVSKTYYLSIQVYHIISLSDRFWRRIETTSITPSSSLGNKVNIFPPCMHISPPIIVADALHWIANEACRILAFKIETTEFHYFKFPVLVTSAEIRDRRERSCGACFCKFIDYSNEKTQLIENNGKICFCHISIRHSEIDLWILEEYGDWSSWILRFKVKLPHVTIYDGCYLSGIWGATILSFPGKDVIAIKWKPRNIYLYHLITRQLRCFDDDIVSSYRLGTTSYRFVAFDKTLLSPNIITYKSTFQC